MILECTNITLSWISVMMASISKLILEVFGCDGSTHAVENFIVKFVEKRDDTSSF